MATMNVQKMCLALNKSHQRRLNGILSTQIERKSQYQLRKYVIFVCFLALVPKSENCIFPTIFTTKLKLPNTIFEICPNIQAYLV